MTNLTTGDWGTIHKLKPRSFIKVILHSDIFFCLLEPYSSFSIITKYYLFSKVVQYIVLEYTSIFYSSPLSSVCFILDTWYHFFCCWETIFWKSTISKVWRLKPGTRGNLDWSKGRISVVFLEFSWKGDIFGQGVCFLIHNRFLG